jgi:FkbM family methyltransferase
MPLDDFDVEKIIKSFPCHQGPTEDGYVIDFLGTRTRAAYIRGLPAGWNEEYPLPRNFHATALEWAGVLAGACDAALEMVAVELGAGWAPWLVAAERAAQMRGIKHVRLLGVEGSRHHWEYMFTHFADNGLDPAKHTLLHGIVGVADGVAEFPVLAEPSLDWGASAVASPVVVGDRASPARRLLKGVVRPLVKAFTGQKAPAGAVEQVRSYSMATLLQPFQTVDVVHVDIQGHEYSVVSSARKTLLEKVKRLVIGTHGRGIEQQLFEELSTAGWRLEAEESCSYRAIDGKPSLFLDGCQVWRNPRLLPQSAACPARAAA